MIAALLIFIGGGIGSVARHGVNLFAMRWLSIDFPWGTFIVNVVGSVTMGVLAAWFAFRTDVPQEARLLLTTGFLGGFTTFSTFSLDTALLVERGAYGTAAAYALGSVAISLFGLFLGVWLVRGAT
jgi:CrcB protein